MIAKMKGTKRLKIIFIILNIIFIYFISQKIIIKKYDDKNEWLSLYDAVITKTYLKIKYPFKTFEITGVYEEFSSIFEKNFSIDGLLMCKEVYIQDEKNLEFTIYIKYLSNPLSFVISPIKEIINRLKEDNNSVYYRPFYFGVLIDDNIKSETKRRKIENEFNNEVQNIIKNYLNNKEFEVDILTLSNKYESDKIQTMEDSIKYLQEKDITFSVAIHIYMNEIFDVNDTNKIKAYYEMSKNILNDLETHLKYKVKLEKFRFTIKFATIDDKVYGTYKIIRYTSKLGPIYEEEVEGLFKEVHKK